MKYSDLEILRTAYEQLSSNEKVDIPIEVWGINTSSVSLLKNLIIKDFSATTYGIAWWENYSELGIKRRILISDYLYQCCIALERNLVEAKIHFLQTKHFGDMVRNTMQGMIYAESNEVVKIRHKLKGCIDEHIYDHLESMHVAGFFRAIGSASDCLSSIITGVLGMPINIFTCGYNVLMKTRKKLEKKKLAPLLEIFFKRFDTMLGIDGWLDWALEYRNMLVHRGRLIQTTLLDYKYLFDDKGQQIFTEDNLPKLWTNPVILLPREPDLSEIEVLSSNIEGLYLTEDCEETMQGIFEKMVKLVEDTCSELREAWLIRRNKPELILQPKKQWPIVDRKTELVFNGFKPNKYSFMPEQMSVHLSQVMRMQAACLAVKDKDKWKDMD